MPARINLSPEMLVECRYLYEETMTSINEICSRMAFSRTALYARRDEYGWVRRRYCSLPGHPGLYGPPAAARPVAVESNQPDKIETEKSAEKREPPLALAVRVYDAVQRQMDAIEAIQKTLRPTQEIQSERTVRILAALNRALREIAAITKTDETTFSDAADNDPVPHDLDCFRRELARRIKGLVDAERGRAGEGAGGASDALAG
jgi:hypothetical protein